MGRTGDAFQPHLPFPPVPPPYPSVSCEI
jgi:hypothetical protein